MESWRIEQENDGQLWIMGAGCWKMYVAAARAIVTRRIESADRFNKIRALDPYHVLQMLKSPHTIGSERCTLLNTIAMNTPSCNHRSPASMV